MYQRLTIIGNLGNDPEMRYLPSGQAVTNISVATNRKYTDSNGNKVTETAWFRVSVWGNQGENVNQYLRKGSKVLVEGRLRPDPETGGPKVYTRNDGSPGASFEMTAQRVLFLSTKEEDQAYQANNGGSSAPATSAADIDEDDIPF